MAKLKCFFVSVGVSIPAPSGSEADKVFRGKLPGRKLSQAPSFAHIEEFDEDFSELKVSFIPP